MRQKLKVVIIDDEKDVRESISQWLTLSGFETQEFQSAQQAFKVINKDYPGVITVSYTHLTLPTLLLV